MNMVNKYYTPDVTDIRIGYELEFLTNDLTKKYTSVIFDSKFAVGFNSVDFLEHSLKHNAIRTKYLTKEDIEKEGWIENGPFMFFDFINDSLVVFEENYEISFEEQK